MGPLTRLHDWQPRLHAWLRAARTTPIRPGHHDCCLFGAGAIEAQTGIDIAAPWRGRYTTFAGGRRILRKAGFADHVALIAAIAQGDPAHDLNVFSSRRGNWEAMLRGLFTNTSVRNLLAPGIPPGSTILPDGTVLPLWQAARRLEAEGTPVVIVAGERYGMGSSRDWATKDAALLGVCAVLAASFERIHRANLIGMGILPLRLQGATPQTLGLTAADRIELDADPAGLSPRAPVPVRPRRASGHVERLDTIAAAETSLEIETLAQGGLIPLILERATRKAA